MKRGKSEVKSQPALIEFAEILVPICAMIKEADMNHTPKRVACDGLPSKNMPSKVIGDQIGSPNNTSEEEPTTMPMKLTIENANGTAINWGHNAAEGVDAREAKSGAFLRYKS